MFLFLIAHPTDPGVIIYFRRIGEFLSSNGESEQDKDSELDDIYTVLSMTEQELYRLKLKNVTKTARAIIKALYPVEVRPTTDIDDIKTTVCDAISDKIFALITC